MYKSIILIILILYTSLTLAQAPQNRQMRDPAQMANMEKQLLLDSLKTLNTDQRIIIEAIYNDYAEAIKNARADMQTGDREAMRSKMMKVRNEKTEALKAILTEEQFKKYESVMKARMEQFRNRRNKRND